MKTYYAIHQIDKTHVNTDYDCLEKFDLDLWTLVQADSEGWIAHTGKECPLPDDVMCDTKWDDGQGGPRVAAYHWKWHDPSITHYRPILTEKVQEPEPHPTEFQKSCVEALQKRFHPQPTEPMPSLLEQLAEAHEAAAKIPDIIAQIKAMLEQYGHTVVPLSPFVAAEFVEPEAAVETTQDKVIAGALFEFLGFLTTRDKPTSFGATRNASPAVKLLKEWADKRGLDLDGADVEGWR